MSILDKQTEPQPVTIKDKSLSCNHCGSDTFYIKHPVILFSGDIINTRVTCFVCSECTHMHWFDSRE